MDENKFWLLLWAIFSAVACTLIVSLTLYNYSVNQAKLAAIKGGGDPLAVSCAFDSAGTLCAVLVARK